MKAITTLKDQLKHGDIVCAAAIVGCNEKTIRRMLLDPTDPQHLNSDTDLGKSVIQALTLMAKTRAHLRTLPAPTKRKRATA